MKQIRVRRKKNKIKLFTNLANYPADSFFLSVLNVNCFLFMIPMLILQKKIIKYIIVIDNAENDDFPLVSLLSGELKRDAAGDAQRTYIQL